MKFNNLGEMTILIRFHCVDLLLLRSKFKSPGSKSRQ